MVWTSNPFRDALDEANHVPIKSYHDAIKYAGQAGIDSANSRMRRENRKTWDDHDRNHAANVTHRIMNELGYATADHPKGKCYGEDIELEEGVISSIKRGIDKLGGWNSAQARRIRQKAKSRYQSTTAAGRHKDASKNAGRHLATLDRKYQPGYMGGHLGSDANSHRSPSRRVESLVVRESVTIDHLSDEAFGVVVLVVNTDHYRDELDKLMYHNGSVNAIRDFLEASAESEGEHLSSTSAYDAAAFIKDNWHHIDDIGAIDEEVQHISPELRRWHKKSGVQARRVRDKAFERARKAADRGAVSVVAKNLVRADKARAHGSWKEETELSEENPDPTRGRWKGQFSYERGVARRIEKRNKGEGAWRREGAPEQAKRNIERQDQEYAAIRKRLHGESVDLQEKSLFKRLKRIVQAHTPGTAAHAIRQSKKPSHKGGPSLFGTDKVSVDSRKWAMRVSNDPKEYNAVQKSDDRRHRNEKQRRIAAIDRIRRDRDLGRKG